MKTILDRRTLSEVLSIALRAVPSRSALPIQTHFLFSAEENSLKVAGADYELQIESRVPAQVIEPGQTTCPARTLVELVSRLPEADVQLEGNAEGHFLLQCQNSEYELRGEPAEEFPPLNWEVGVGEEGITFQIRASLLKEMVRHTVFAVSDDPARPQFNGLDFILQGNRFKMVATDGSRLALREDDLEEEPQGDPTRLEQGVECIVPAKTLVEFSRIVGSEEDLLIEVSLSPNQIAFRWPNTLMVSRLIEGKFPPFERVIPKEGRIRWSVATADLLNAVQRCRIIAGESHRLLLKTEENQLHILAESAPMGRGHEQVEIVKEGEDIEIAFDGRYLSDFLSVVPSEGVMVQLTAPLSPGVFKPLEGPSLTYVLMPMQLI